MMWQFNTDKKKLHYRENKNFLYLSASRSTSKHATLQCFLKGVFPHMRTHQMSKICANNILELSALNYMLLYSLC